MCFYHDDYDWIAEVYETTTDTAQGRVRCDECHGWIEPGEAYTHIHMEQREEWLPYDDDNNEIAGPWEEGEEPSPGETDDYDRCSNCDKLIKAIEAAEIEEGCEGVETMPGLRGLGDAMCGRGDGPKYAAKAREMFPELPKEYMSKMCPWEDE